jgi:hypothetical protein
MKQRVFTLTLEVRAPVLTGEAEVANAINAALDEPACDWGDWAVSAAVITSVIHEETGC